jgi:hypothetical protein
MVQRYVNRHLNVIPRTYRFDHAGYIRGLEFELEAKNGLASGVRRRHLKVNLHVDNNFWGATSTPNA